MNLLAFVPGISLEGEGSASQNTAVADVCNVDAAWNMLRLPESRSLFSFATICWHFSPTQWPSGRTAKFLFGTSKPGTIIEQKVLENNGFHIWKDKLIYMSIPSNKTHSCHTQKGGAPIWTHSISLSSWGKWEAGNEDLVLKEIGKPE